MLYRLLADAVVIFRAAFVLFVVCGALLVLKWRKVVWLHVPCALWGGLIELAGWVCPLTPLEDWLRTRAGQVAYTGDFMEHHILPILYPERLSRGVQIGLGLAVLVLNIGVYAFLITRGSKEGH